MNWKNQTVFVLAVGLLLSIAGILGSTAKETKASPNANPNANLCVEYSGSFLWDEKDPELQKVRIRFSNINVELGGKITAYGAAVYNTNGKTSYSEVKLKVDQKSLRIEMWEENSNDPDFVTDGSHVGRISADLMSIKATWTTNSNGETGVLRLEAHESCSGLST